MIDLIEEIKKEHEDIERELIELETIMEFDEINYSNLVHVLKKLTDLWEKHEDKEEELVFPLLDKKINLKIPVKKMSFQHKELAPKRKEIVSAINLGDESKVREKLNNELKEIIQKLRDHINEEDEIIYTFPFEEVFSN